MYVQCKAGFFEVDRWDGSPFPVREQQEDVNDVAASRLGVVVVRCRHRKDLEQLLLHYSKGGRRIWKSPKGWDYAYRTYMTPLAWGEIMRNVAVDLDYRNFKAWTRGGEARHHRLAHDIWEAANHLDEGLTFLIEAPGPVEDVVRAIRSAVDGDCMVCRIREENE